MDSTKYMNELCQQVSRIASEHISQVQHMAARLHYIWVHTTRTNTPRPAAA